jgi:hypothetical protein
VSKQGYDNAAYEVVDDLVRRDFSAVTERFDESMAEGLPETVLRELWEQVSQAFGEFESRGRAEIASHEGFTVVNVPVTFSAGAAQLQLAFDEQGRIAGMHVLSPST